MIGDKRMLKKILDNKKNIIAITITILVLVGTICYYAIPSRDNLIIETGSYTSEEQQAITDEVTDYLMKYVVSDGFVNQIGESEDLKTRLAEKIEKGEITLLNEVQINEIAQYAAENYSTMLSSDIDALTDEQVQELEQNIRDNIIVTIGEHETKEEDINMMSNGVSSIVIKNILAQLDQMNESIVQLQQDLNVIKENIALGSSFTEISDSIGKLEERLEYVKDNLSEEDQALASDISEIEEDLRTLHVNVDETATVVVQLESTMDDLTKSNLDSLSLQVGSAEGAISKINDDFQKILDKINNLQTSMSSKDTELSNIVKEAADKVADLSGLLSALQKELSNYKNATDKVLKTMQDSQNVLDKNLSTYKNNTDKSLTNLQNDQNTIGKNLSEFKDITDADILNIYSIINNLQSSQNSAEVDLTEIKNKLVSLDEDMKQVFISVSSGKTALASALTDKGIQTDAAATFNLLEANTRAIGSDANVVASAMLPGYVAYVGNDYVTGNMIINESKPAVLNCGESFAISSGYHTGEGIIKANSLASQTQATAIADNMSKGVTGWVNGRMLTGTGADNTTAYNMGYTDGMKDAMNNSNIQYTYHSHSGNNISGGGCYTVEDIHNHANECYTITTTIKTVKSYNVRDSGKKYDCCNGAGAVTWAVFYDVVEKDSDNNIISSKVQEGTIIGCGQCVGTKANQGVGTSNNKVLNCSIPEGVLLGYALGCGKTENTIESATIVFQ